MPPKVVSAPSHLRFVQDQDKWDLRTIPIADIREASEALREVDRDSEEYVLLKDSVASRGLLLPILVRELQDAQSGKKVYQIVDGAQRFAAMSELGSKNIPANVVDISEGEVFEAQLIANAKRVETKPAQFATHMVKILGQNPLLTRQELATKLSTSKSWIDQHLNLTRLLPALATLVDEGKIIVTNALALSKLPQDEQLEFADVAQTQSPTDFTARVAGRLKEIKDAARAGRDAAPVEWSAQPALRKPVAVKNEWEQPTVFKEVLAATGADTPEKGFAAAIAWTLQMDPQTVELKRQEELKRKQLQADITAKKKKEREEVAAALAAKRQAEAAEQPQLQEAVA